MTASYVTLTLDRYDGEGNPYVKGTATFTPSLEFPDTADQMLVGMAPVTATFRAGSLPTVRLIANDTAGPQGVSLPGWTWNVTYSSDTPGSPAAASYYILSTNGATQRLSSLASVPAAQPGAQYVPLPNTPPADATKVLGLSSASPLATQWVAQSGGGSGTVTTVSVASANGFAGTVATPTTTPAITLQATPTGILKSNGTAVSAAAAGTDYLAPNGSGAALTGITESQVTNLVSDLAAKAPLASPTFTGTVTVPSTVGATDAAQKAYVDSVAQGLDNKQSVTALASSNITLSGTQTIDGVAVTAGQRVLATGQSTASQNGLWAVASGAWTRPVDFASGSTQLGASVFVEGGTSNSSSGWVLTGTSAVTVDTSSQTWTQFSGAGEINAGTGLSKSGNTLSNTGVLSVTAADTSVVVGGTAAAPTVRTGTLDVIAAQHPPAAAVAMNGQKITGGANGVASTDFATVQQTLGGGNSAPLTTLGDMLYEGTGPAPARLAGNTTATKNFLTQTGNGSVSAAPAWGTIQAADVPGVRGTVTTGDAIQLTGCTLANNSAAATFAGASLTGADVGKTVVAVHGQDSLVTTISAVNSPTTVTLAAVWPGTGTSGATVTYGTDQTAAINALLAANARVVIASPVLCTGTLIVPDSTQLTGLGFSLGGTVYAGHYGNIVQSSLWGAPSVVQNQFCDAYDLTLIGLLPVTQPGLGQTDSASASTYLFTTVQLAAGTLSQVFTSGAFPVSGTLDSRWPAGSVGSPVYFWHNNVLFQYTSATPFATTTIVDPSVGSATVLTHGFVYPLNSQGHGVAFQSFRGRVTRVRTVNVRGSGVRVQGSGTADPTAYGHRIEWIRTESPGWAGVDLGESTTDDFLDIVSVTSPGVAGLIVMGGDPTVRTVHAVGQPTRPWVPHVVACPTNGSYRDVILDTCYGPGFVLDGGLQFRGVGPSETVLNGLRYLGSSGKPGHGTPILAKTRASTINVQQLGISGVTFTQDCAFLFTHGPQTEVANGTSLTLSTSASVVPVLDVTGMDAQGGKVNIVHAGLTKTVTYTGTSINTTLTGGANQSITIGTGGTIALSQAFPAVPVSGDWYVIGGLVAVNVDPANTGGNSLVYTTSVSLYGASGAVAIAGGSFASRQTLTGCTIVSGTQVVSTGDLTTGFQLQQGNVQGSLSAPGATGMLLPSAQPAVLVKNTDALLVTPDSQVGAGTGPAPVTVTASYTAGGSDSVIIANGAGITITLPTAAGIAGKPYTVANAAAQAVTVSPQGGQVIGGAAGYTVPALAGSSVTVMSDGTNWQVTGGALSSPGRVILVNEYAPATITGKTVSTATLSAFDTATLTTGSFTVPPSGVVIVEVNCIAVTPTANNVYAFALAAHGTVTPVLGNVITAETSSANNKIPHALKFRLTGLTPGAALNLDLLGAIAANTLTIEAIGTQSTTPTAAAGGPVTFTVTEAF